MKRNLNIGSLNVRGCKSVEERETVIKDCILNDIDIIGITETHVAETGLENFKLENKEYILYHCGEANDNYHGVGFAVKKELQPTFKQLSGNLCKCEINLKNRKLVAIVAYAPTLSKSEKNPEIRESFYEQLDKAINQVANRHALVVLGDFNAKTGSAWKEYPEVMGKFGKGLVNNNGLALLECMKTNGMVLTNTLFRHKLSHITTWEAPMKTFTNKSENKLLLGPDGKPRRNPFRNQIDYIAVRSEHRRFVKNSKSTNNINTETDHKMVKTEMNFEWYKMKKNKKEKVEKVNMSNFSNKEKQQEYKKKLIEKILIRI